MELCQTFTKFGDYYLKMSRQRKNWRILMEEMGPNPGTLNIGLESSLFNKEK